jgi:hypothetical protein
MSAHNLDEGATDSFEFIMGGHTYSMRYPNTEEITEAEKLASDSDKQVQWFYSFITPVGEGPSIEETIKKANIKLVKRFNQMVAAEFSAED